MRKHGAVIAKAGAARRRWAAGKGAGAFRVKGRKFETTSSSSASPFSWWRISTLCTRCSCDARDTRYRCGRCFRSQQRTRIFSLRPLRTTAVLWCAPDALQAAGAAAGAGTVAATLGPSAPVIRTPKVRGAPDTGTSSTRGTVSSELKVNVQDVARLCSRKSHVKVRRRLRAGAQTSARVGVGGVGRGWPPWAW